MGTGCMRHAAFAGHGPALPGGNGMGTGCMRHAASAGHGPALPGGDGMGTGCTRHAAFAGHGPALPGGNGMGTGCMRHAAFAGHGPALPDGVASRSTPCVDGVTCMGSEPSRCAQGIRPRQKQRPGKSRAFAGSPWRQPRLTRSPPAGRRCGPSASRPCTGMQRRRSAGSTAHPWHGTAPGRAGRWPGGPWRFLRCTWCATRWPS